MPRIEISLPDELCFTTELPIFIGHINYGGHLDNALLLSLVESGLGPLRRTAAQEISECTFLRQPQLARRRARRFQDPDRRVDRSGTAAMVT